MIYHFQFIMKVKLKVLNVTFDLCCAGLLHIFALNFGFVSNLSIQPLKTTKTCDFWTHNY